MPGGPISWLGTPVLEQLEMARAPSRRASEAIEVFRMVFMVVVFDIVFGSDEWRNATLV